LSGKDRRRSPFKKDGRNRIDFRNSQENKKKGDFRARKEDVQNYNKGGSFPERPRWIAPKQNTDPMPILICCRCGLVITDVTTALTDKLIGKPVHFDCVIAELAKQETLEAGDDLSYIGGGRFGIIRFSSGKGESRNLSIKKIFEWEDKEKRAEWRGTIADHYSVT